MPRILGNVFRDFYLSESFTRAQNYETAADGLHTRIAWPFRERETVKKTERISFDLAV